MSTKRHAPICNWDNFFFLSLAVLYRETVGVRCNNGNNVITIFATKKKMKHK